VNDLSNSLEPIAETIRANFIAKDTAREKILPLCREVIRYCSLCIRAIHRQEYNNAVENVSQAQTLLYEIKKTSKPYNELISAGFVHDAEKEFAEASITMAIIRQQPLPSPKKLNVSDGAYLNGMGEAAGELRRYLLDGLRNGDTSRSEILLCAMDDIYSLLVTMDFPDAITYGLRRTTDMVRGVLEKLVVT